LRRPRRCAGGRGGLGGHCRPGWLGCAAAAVEGGLLRLCCAGSCSPRVWIRCAALPAERRSFSRAAPGMRMQALCSTRFCTCRQRLAPRVAPIPPPPISCHSLHRNFTGAGHAPKTACGCITQDLLPFMLPLPSALAPHPPHAGLASPRFINAMTPSVSFSVFSCVLPAPAPTTRLLPTCSRLPPAWVALLHDAA
jgi:hypothetical protein